MNTTRIFRKEVPEELVLRFFNSIGLKSLGDCSWFSKYTFVPSVCDKLDRLMNELEPYYYPHKAFLCKREMTVPRYVQVLRQLAKTKGLKLESKEQKDKNNLGKKITLYRLKSNEGFQSQEVNFTLTFW